MFQNLINLFFPNVCLSCNHELLDNEIYICTNCRHDLPVTNYHLDGSDQVKKAFYGRVKLENASALLRFQKKGIVQQLMHNLKYKGHQEIGTFLGAWLGDELKNIVDYKDIDLVIPVPLHKIKRRKRGYNQVTLFSKEIANCMNIESLTSVLVKDRKSVV